MRDVEREGEEERENIKCWKRIVHQIDDMKMKIINSKTTMPVQNVVLYNADVL